MWNLCNGACVRTKRILNQTLTFLRFNVQQLVKGIPTTKKNLNDSCTQHANIHNTRSLNPFPNPVPPCLPSPFLLPSPATSLEAAHLDKEQAVHRLEIHAPVHAVVLTTPTHQRVSTHRHRHRGTCIHRDTVRVRDARAHTRTHTDR